MTEPTKPEPSGTPAEGMTHEPAPSVAPEPDERTLPDKPRVPDVGEDTDVPDDEPVPEEDFQNPDVAEADPETDNTEYQ